MDMLAGYSDDADSNTPNVDRFQQMSAKMESDSSVKDNACNLEAEWESFEKMISGQQDTKPCAVPPVGVAPPLLGEAPMDLDSDEEESMPILTKITASPSPTHNAKHLSSSSESRASSVESDKNTGHTQPSVVPRAYAYDLEKNDENVFKDVSGSKSRSASPTEQHSSRSCSRSRSPTPVSRSKSRSKSPIVKEKSRSKSLSPSVKHRRSSEGKHSRSRSRERKLHGSGKRHRRSRSRSHDRKRHSSRERRKHKDRHRRRSHSRDRKSSRSKGHRRSRSRDKKHSRSKSREIGRSKSQSRERKNGSGRHKDRKRSRSRDRKRSRSRDRRRSKSRERRTRPRRSRSRSWSGERESPRVTRAHVPAKNKPVNFKEKMRQQLFNASKLLAEQGASTSGEGDEKDSQKDKIAKLDANAIYKNMSGVTPQMALLQTMAAMHQKAQEITGVAVPKYYNPAAVNPLKYAEQVQKRKLLWSKNKEKKPETDASSQWQASAFISDNDGKTMAKFRKLMGMKEGEEQTVDEDKAKELEEIKKKQDDLFYHLDKEYEFARMTTHTQRGVGLGFGSQILPHQ